MTTLNVSSMTLAELKAALADVRSEMDSISDELSSMGFHVCYPASLIAKRVQVRDELERRHNQA